MRTYQGAVAFAEHQHLHPDRNWQGLCQKFARECVGAAPYGLTAKSAWDGTPASWRRGGTPQPGSVAYWGGGSKGAGHAAFVVERGLIWSTDILRTGKVDKVHYSRINTDWNLPYLGWIVRCPSGALPVLATVHPAPIVHVSRVQPGDTNTEVLVVQKALNAEPQIVLDYSSGPGVFGKRTRAAYTQWQKILGFDGSDADGAPGISSLTTLGGRHGFRVAP